MKKDKIQKSTDLSRDISVIGDLTELASRESPYRIQAMKQRTLAVKIALVSLLLGTAILYIVGLDKNGWANQFYSAAVQAGSVNWESFLWGSLDSANSITVDKPPAALWVMALSVRLFGLSSWSILVPEALMGVGCVYLVYATVRRSFGEWCAILSGSALAVTPVACLMFRFNNPDALLMLLLCSATYCVTRSIEPEDTRSGNKARTLWLFLAGILMGFAFLTKQLQAFLVLPPFGLAFLLASPTSWKRRWLDALAAFGALLISAGWWVLLTVIVPADSRPYFGGSQTNSFLELTFSYNGLGRITGSMEGAVVNGNSSSSVSQSGMWGQTGITRLFDGVWGTQWSWLAPVALVGIVVALILCGRINEGSRRDPRRVQVILWGGWLVITGLVFSFMSGTTHQYYTVALVPATSALSGICIYLLWSRVHVTSDKRWRLVALMLTCCESIWSAMLLSRSDWYAWLRIAVLGCGVLSATIQIVLWTRSRKSNDVVNLDVKSQKLVSDAQKKRWASDAALSLALVAAFIGPLAYSLYTVNQGYSGSIVTAGPSISEASTTFGGTGGRNSAFSGDSSNNIQGNSGGFSSNDRLGDGQAQTDTTPSDDIDNKNAFGDEDVSFSNRGNLGSTSTNSLLSGSDVSEEVTTMLSDDSSSYTWVAAAIGSQNAASYQLACQLPVMAVGGFNGSDPSPTLEQFEAYVAAGKIHYFIESSMSGTQIGGSNDAQEIANWVAENFESQDVDGVTIYDLS